MLRRLTIHNFTVFGAADLDFSPGLNLFIGENGAGKTHLLKLAYATSAVSWEEGRRVKEPTKSLLQTRLADKLVGVFRPEALGRLTRRRQGRERCDVRCVYKPSTCNLRFGFATNSTSEVRVDLQPARWLETAPIYLPTRELLTIYPGFVSLYESRYLEFDETWRDTCLLLGAPLRRGPRQGRIHELLAPLEEAMEGSVELDRNGRFYLRTAGGRMEMPLVAEGLRKLATLARLVATGVLLDQGYLFWDEPEANLNPRLIRAVARCLVDLSVMGLQVFLATHSLFLLREIEILLGRPDSLSQARFFGLHRGDDGVEVQSGDELADIGEIAALEEELLQSDRFVELS